MTNEQAAAPTVLAPYRAMEETRLRYSSSLTILDLVGSTAADEGYSLRVYKTGETTFYVTWCVRTLEAPSICNTVRGAFWGKRWSAKFRTEAKALAFAGPKLEALRNWADKRAAVAA